MILPHKPFSGKGLLFSGWGDFGDDSANKALHLTGLA
jgi:hypothetical protein